MFLAGPKGKNPLASKLASDFRPFDLGIKIIIVIRYLKVKGIPRLLRILSIFSLCSVFFLRFLVIFYVLFN